MRKERSKKDGGKGDLYYFDHAERGFPEPRGSSILRSKVRPLSPQTISTPYCGCLKLKLQNIEK